MMKKKAKKKKKTCLNVSELSLGKTTMRWTAKRDGFSNEQLIRLELPKEEAGTEFPAFIPPFYHLKRSRKGCSELESNVKGYSRLAGLSFLLAFRLMVAALMTGIVYLAMIAFYVLETPEKRKEKRRKRLKG